MAMRTGARKPSSKAPAKSAAKAAAKTAGKKPANRGAKATGVKAKAAKASGARAVRAMKPVSQGEAPRLLSGGNPQIAKGDGDAPVQAYIAAMPGWKRDVGSWIDRVIVEAVPGVRKAVKWNSPFYGMDGQGWFLSLHVFAKYVKVAFFRGTLLTPMPPGSSKSPEVRYLDIREGDALDTAQMTRWVQQAAAIPGWQP